MLIKEKTGNIGAINIANKTVDWLDLEWFEADKRIMHKHTHAGIEVGMKFLNERQQLTDGDILYEDATMVIAVNILPCEVLVIRPKDMYEMAGVCYEIGNKHIPLFYENDMVLVAFDAPLLLQLTAAGYAVETAIRKLLRPIKTSVAPHALINNETVFVQVKNLAG